jgi:hypothetical protein
LKGGIAIEYIPDGLRQIIAKSTEEPSKAVETLKAEYFEAVRRRNYETACRTYVGIAARLWSRSPAIVIVVGQSGYVLFDGKRIRLAKH